MARGRRASVAVLLVVIVPALLCPLLADVPPTRSYFSGSVDGPRLTLETGAAGPRPVVTVALPCFGVSGICAWPVFFGGTDLGRVSGVSLSGGGVSVEASKVWHIGDCLLYCVFDLRGLPGGEYEVHGTVDDADLLLLSGWHVLAFGGGGLKSGAGAGGRLVPAAPPGPTGAAEDPREFTLTVVGNDLFRISADVRGPAGSTFVSASLVRDGLKVDGAVEGQDGSGCRVAFSRTGAPPGKYDLILNRPDGSGLLLEGSFSVTAYVPPANEEPAAPAPAPAPEPGSSVDAPTGPPPSPPPVTPPAAAVTAVAPEPCQARAGAILIVSGAGLSPGMRAKLMRGEGVLWAQSVRFENPSRLRCLFDLGNAPPGEYLLAVIAEGGSATFCVRPVRVIEPR